MANEEKSQVEKKNLQKDDACSDTNAKQEQPTNTEKTENNNDSKSQNVNQNTNADTKEEVKEKGDAEQNEEMNKKLKKTQEELQKQKDVLLRTAAEYNNYRKRTEREKTAIYKDAEAETIEKILPVADNLERALSQEECTVEDLKKGVEMVNKQLVDALTKLGVTTMGEVGDEFDPELHNAVSHIEDENIGENKIARVLQKGYKIGDKIIRHAMVQVAN